MLALIVAIVAVILLLPSCGGNSSKKAGDVESTTLVKAGDKAPDFTVEMFGGGTSNPYFTTDSASALRGIEIEADVMLKGTRVDGVYTADPEKDPTAVKFDRITFEEVLDRRLKVMDLTAFTLCRENGLGIIVFDMDTPGNLGKVLAGEQIGTLVTGLS